jgi:hypothetical protein
MGAAGYGGGEDAHCCAGGTVDRSAGGRTWGVGIGPQFGVPAGMSLIGGGGVGIPPQ